MKGKALTLTLAGGSLAAVMAGFALWPTDAGTTDVARSIAPMGHWEGAQEDVVKQWPLRLLTTARTSIGYDDPDPGASAEQFREYVNGIAGFDVAADAQTERYQSHYYCGRNVEIPGTPMECSAGFQKQVGVRRFDVIVEVGMPLNTVTRKPAEITVVAMD